jgi:hypothetical protein
MFSHIIVPGILIIAGIILFVPPAEVQPTQTVEVKHQVFDEHAAYIKDCVEVAEYTKVQCENLWLGRNEVEKSENDSIKFEAASKVTPIDVQNVEYKQRRDEVLKDPNAVIGHVVYHDKE